MPPPDIEDYEDYYESRLFWHDFYQWMRWHGFSRKTKKPRRPYKPRSVEDFNTSEHKEWVDKVGQWNWLMAFAAQAEFNELWPCPLPDEYPDRDTWFRAHSQWTHLRSKFGKGEDIHIPDFARELARAQQMADVYADLDQAEARIKGRDKTPVEPETDLSAPGHDEGADESDGYIPSAD